jgi:hypothetical protein
MNLSTSDFLKKEVAPTFVAFNAPAAFPKFKAS